MTRRSGSGFQVLVSFQLASKYPEALIALCDNLEQRATDPTCFEVLVKIDIEDPLMQAAVAAEASRRKFRLRPLITPRQRGYEDLWQALNEVYALTDPDAYFVCNINDEVRIREQGWDERLSRYIGLFPDHIFRLRTSRLKFHNYYDFWECGYAPENYAFFTKRWLDVCGDWNPCFGPDSSQQYIAYYLGYANHPSIKQYNRDVPILDLSWGNEGVGHNLTPVQQERRTAANFRLWSRQVSHPMQEELYRRARLLQAHIIQAECEFICPIEITDERSSRTVLLRDARDGSLLDLLPYKISRIGLFFRNLRRHARFTFFAGGGRDSRNVLPISVIEYLVLRHLWLRRSLTSASRYRGRLRASASRYRLRASASRHRLAAFASRGRTCLLGAPAAAIGPLLRGIGRLMPTRGPQAVKPPRGLRMLPRSLEWCRPLLRPLVRAVMAFAAGVSQLLLRPLVRGVRTFAAGVWQSLLRPLVRGVMTFTYRVLRMLVRGLRSFLSPGVWRHHGNRLSLALMDRDLRWLTIKEHDRRKIAAIRDPWFDPTSKPLDKMPNEPVVANPHDPEVQDISPTAVQDSDEAAPGDRNVPGFGR